MTQGEGWRGHYHCKSPSDGGRHTKNLKSGPRRARGLTRPFASWSLNTPLRCWPLRPYRTTANLACTTLQHASCFPRRPRLRRRACFLGSVRLFAQDWPSDRKNVCAALQHTQQTVIRRKYSGTLFQDALDRGGRVHNRSAPSKPCSQDLNMMNEFQSRMPCRNEFYF